MASLVSRITDLTVAIRTKINAMMPRLVPSGGAGGQVLRKTTATDYDTSWLTLGAIAAFAEATAAEFRSATASRALSAANTWASGAIVTLTDAATIAVNMSSFINAQVTLAGNRTLGAPSNTKVGQTGLIRVIQDATGSRTLSYNSVYKFVGGSAPTLTTTAGASDFLQYFVFSSTFILIIPIKDVK